MSPNEFRTADELAAQPAPKSLRAIFGPYNRLDVAMVLVFSAVFALLADSPRLNGEPVPDWLLGVMVVAFALAMLISPVAAFYAKMEAKSAARKELVMSDTWED